MDYRNKLILQKYYYLQNLVNRRADENWYLRAAADLRFLLIEENGSHITESSNEQKIPLLFTVIPLCSDFEDGSIKAHLLVNPIALEGLTLRYINPRNRLDLENFLQTPMVEVEGKTYTIENVIKNFANKMGGVHLEFEKGFFKLFQKQNLYKNTFIHAIAVITDLVLVGLKDLIQAISPLNKVNLTGWYDAYPNNIQFEQKSLNIDYGDGISIKNSIFSFQILFANQQDNPAYLYEISTRDKSKRFSIGIKDDYLFASFKDGEIENGLSIPIPSKYNLFTLMISIRCIKSISTISFFASGRKLAAAELPAPVYTGPFHIATVGADINEENGLVFTMDEWLLVVGGNIEESIKQVSSHFSLKYNS